MRLDFLPSSCSYFNGWITIEIFYLQPPSFWIKFHKWLEMIRQSVVDCCIIFSNDPQQMQNLCRKNKKSIIWKPIRATWKVRRIVGLRIVLVSETIIRVVSIVWLAWRLNFESFYSIQYGQKRKNIVTTMQLYGTREWMHGGIAIQSPKTMESLANTPNKAPRLKNIWNLNWFN